MDERGRRPDGMAVRPRIDVVAAVNVRYARYFDACLGRTATRSGAAPGGVIEPHLCMRARSWEAPLFSQTSTDREPRKQHIVSKTACAMLKAIRKLPNTQRYLCEGRCMRLLCVWAIRCRRPRLRSKPLPSLASRKRLTMSKCCFPNSWLDAWSHSDSASHAAHAEKGREHVNEQSACNI